MSLVESTNLNRLYDNPPSNAEFSETTDFMAQRADSRYTHHCWSYGLRVGRSDNEGYVGCRNGGQVRACREFAIRHGVTEEQVDAALHKGRLKVAMVDDGWEVFSNVTHEPWHVGLLDVGIE